MKKTIVDVFVPCIPPKATKQNTHIIKLRNKSGKEFYSLKSDESVKQASGTILDLFKEYAPCSIIDFPVRVKIWFNFPFRKNEKKADIVRGEMWCETRPDLDNLSKLFIDAISPVFFKDDSLIVCITASKTRSATPGIGLVIERAVTSSICR